MKKKSIFELLALCFIPILIMSCEPIKEADSTDTTSGNQSSPITDTEGNSYKTVTIGTQVWMAENLKTTKYNDGTSIPLVTDATAWVNLKTPGYCWYDNDATKNKNTYGGLYNWFTVYTGKLCPAGWHVPTDAEWTVLTTFLGGEGVAGGKLREVGTSHWETPTTEASNSTGFTALPGGFRVSYGSFDFMGVGTSWWSSSENGSGSIYSWGRTIEYNRGNIVRDIDPKNYGYSVRCLKN